MTFMRRILLFLTILGAGFFASHAYADSGCTKDKQQELDATAPSFNADDWETLYISYAKYASCDDGWLAEDYSDTVVNFLSKKWDQLDSLAKLIKTHPGFKKFVIRHLDGSVSKEEIDQIIKLSSSSCPSAQLNLCKEINQRAVAVKNGAL